MKKSQNPNELITALDQEREKQNFGPWTTEELLVRGELRDWVVKMADMIEDEKQEERAAAVARAKMLKTKQEEMQGKGKKKKTKKEQSEEEEPSDDDIYMEEEHSDESDMEHMKWEREPGEEEQEVGGEDEEQSELSENDIETGRLMVEIRCSENSRMTREARRRGWRAVRVTRRNNIYRPKTMKKLKKLLDPENLKKKKVERVHTHLSLPCTPFSSFSNPIPNRKPKP